MHIEAHSDKDVMDHLGERLLTAGMGLHQGVHYFQRGMVIEALKMCGGNQSRTARLLHIHRNSLARYIKELKIAPSSYICRRSARELTTTGWALKVEA